LVPLFVQIPMTGTVLLQHATGLSTVPGVHRLPSCGPHREQFSQVSPAEGWQLPVHGWTWQVAWQSE
jgi:hypothetical protein